MSQTAHNSDYFNRNETITRYNQGTKKPMIGTEIEFFMGRTVSQDDQPFIMMTQDQSQTIMKSLASEPNTKVYSEKVGKRFLGTDKDCPIVLVDTNNVSYQLEFCGVLEAATEPYELNDINILLQFIEDTQKKLAKLANDQGLCLYDSAVLGTATPETCEQNGVNRERLEAEWQKFKLGGKDAPGLRTMGMAASTQVNIGYRDQTELREILEVSYLLSPLLYATFANSAGFEQGEKIDRISRAQWWLDHNKDAPRGGVPEFALDLLFDPVKIPDVSSAWIDYVSATPMVFFFNDKDEADFSRSPTFNELEQEGLGTCANFSLAESLLWPDVKFINGQRVEIRSCDTGPWQATALTVIGASIISDPEGRKQTLDLLRDTKLTRKSFTEARNNVAVDGLDTNFGNTTLRDLLPNILDITCKNANLIGINGQYLTALQVLKENPQSDFDFNRRQLFSNAIEADRALTMPYGSFERLPYATCQIGIDVT